MRKRLIKSLWWKLTLAYVAITLLGSTLIVLIIGPMFDAANFRELVQPAHLKSLISQEVSLLGGRLEDRDLTARLLAAIRSQLQSVEGSAVTYGIAESSEPQVSLAVFDGSGQSLQRLEAAGLELPARWQPGAERLQTVSPTERLLVLPLQPDGTLVIRHYAKFSVLKNLSSSLRDIGVSLWFMVLVISVPGSMLGIGVSLWLARRLRRITRASEAWSRGDFSASIVEQSQDELGEHARSLNAMAAQLASHLKTEQQLAALQERQRMARALHDTVKQQVFACGLQIHAASQWLARDPARAAESMQRAEAINQAVFSGLTELLTALVNSESKSLREALASSLQAWTGQLAWRLDMQEEPSLPAEQVNELCGVVAEAVANAVRHGGARHVDIALHRDGPQWQLSISDQGSGFDTGTTTAGLGLGTMRQRAALLPGGQLDISSGAGGTRVCLRFQQQGAI
ncbi:histidine kinase [Chitinimonas sp.]|uniref:sensor histidine kinase n=1 Tax=Chitinimonas sp. TaxID=1934313 RepID=UPI0035ADE4D5